MMTATTAASVSEADFDRLFAALADPTRRQVLELLGSRPTTSATALAKRLPVSRQAVTQHLTVLEDSRLVRRERVGREVLFSVETERLTAASSWLAARANAWQDRLRSLKREAESGDDTSG